MSVRSLNKVMLIGNLTRDPELRYTPSGTAVCSFGLATNRAWTTEGGEKKEETEFHRIVSWNKLAELCSQLLTKGRKVFVEGRLQTRSWTGQDGAQRTSTEIVIDDMIILDPRRMVESGEGASMPSPAVAAPAPMVNNSQPPTATSNQDDTTAAKTTKTETVVEKPEPEAPKEDINPDDIPF
ncbi:MAG: Single-stranded DNA-binding protein [Candidatus Gottesmanbacteria bacterium GW2011_GWB1_43_11]|uniref:Single-stranded DNA-binding protein n=1 Tax=Candidatus Gottesmanbacteria bacterium GW2011_GWB1_43_11 TaxID=1618446 RepID=A0A0G1EUE3_9BACT|nr:MAG: Single-stranded DNA-binding protein [Candidatus Gottesmanbacteria bacterium GW2011_GWA2_42_16]KKS54935.1 MAG: Single-stranded DNA-binding protein [Candidatus Gottesmanbacteria bacterium GW2011_GWA1_42_26]KKS82125.1 MAG: single-strand binding protein, single-strand DNA-binding protein [Candidatus Gottesmanbacteria bacterium GW2011_GWC1_43_10]KKS86641.1 MAG: Single-stranded DNA-binding protein [Candidatus Gottesmanbacteria bacterium GW2011_GWB1_43_11]OGG10585.1 MAG: hypothetical protein A